MLMLQALDPNNMPEVKVFAFNMLDCFTENKTFLKRIRFSAEALHHVSGELNGDKVRIGVSEDPYFSRKKRRECGIE